MAMEGFSVDERQSTSVFNRPRAQSHRHRLPRKSCRKRAYASRGRRNRRPSPSVAQASTRVKAKKRAEPAKETLSSPAQRHLRNTDCRETERVGT